MSKMYFIRLFVYTVLCISIVLAKETRELKLEDIVERSTTRNQLQDDPVSLPRSVDLMKARILGRRWHQSGQQGQEVDLKQDELDVLETVHGWKRHLREDSPGEQSGTRSDNWKEVYLDLGQKGVELQYEEFSQGNYEGEKLLVKANPTEETFWKEDTGNDTGPSSENSSKTGDYVMENYSTDTLTVNIGTSRAIPRGGHQINKHYMDFTVTQEEVTLGLTGEKTRNLTEGKGQVSVDEKNEYNQTTLVVTSKGDLTLTPLFEPTSHEDLTASTLKDSFSIFDIFTRQRNRGLSTSRTLPTPSSSTKHTTLDEASAFSNSSEYEPETSTLRDQSTNINFAESSISYIEGRYSDPTTSTTKAMVSSSDIYQAEAIKIPMNHDENGLHTPIMEHSEYKVTKYPSSSPPELDQNLGQISTSKELKEGKEYALVTSMKPTASTHIPTTTITTNATELSFSNTYSYKDPEINLTTIRMNETRTVNTVAPFLNSDTNTTVYTFNKTIKNQTSSDTVSQVSVLLGELLLGLLRKQFTWLDLIVTVCCTMALALLCVNVAILGHYLITRRQGKMKVMTSPTQDPPSSTASASDDGFETCEASTVQVRPLSCRRPQLLWNTCPAPSPPDSASRTDVSVVSMETNVLGDQSGQGQHSSASMIASFVNPELIGELTDRDNSCTTASRGFVWGRDYGDLVRYNHGTEQNVGGRRKWPWKIPKIFSRLTK